MTSLKKLTENSALFNFLTKTKLSKNHRKQRKLTLGENFDRVVKTAFKSPEEHFEKGHCEKFIGFLYFELKINRMVLKMAFEKIVFEKM